MADLIALAALDGARQGNMSAGAPSIARTLTAPARRQQPRHKGIPRGLAFSGIPRAWLQSSSGRLRTSRAPSAASSWWPLRQASPRERRQRCPCRLAR
jgi:hypothetical protein